MMRNYSDVSVMPIDDVEYSTKPIAVLGDIGQPQIDFLHRFELNTLGATVFDIQTCPVYIS